MTDNSHSLDIDLSELVVLKNWITLLHGSNQRRDVSRENTESSDFNQMSHTVTLENLDVVTRR